jgi:hypothetical protein
METERNSETEAVMKARLMAGPEQVLFAQTPDGSRIVGVVTDSPPSSLALLAAGVAGMGVRQARKDRNKNHP